MNAAELACDLEKPLVKNDKQVGTSSPSYSCCQKLFLQHRNARFAGNMQLAVRAGFVIVLIGFQSPIVPGTSLSLFGPQSIVMFAFTLWKSVGQTISWACGALIGIVLAVIHTNFMFFIFPDGGDFIFAAINGVVFTWMMLWLNFTLLAQQFALSTFAVYLMSFIKGVPPALLQDFVFASFGIGLAVLATLVPFPRWALDEARDHAQRSNTVIGETMREAVREYCANSRDEVAIADIVGAIDVLKANHGQLEEMVRNAWYEGFGSNRDYRTREMLRTLNALQLEASMRLQSCLQMLRHEAFDESHCNMVSLVRGRAEVVCEEAHELFRLSCTLSLDGVVTEGETTEIYTGMKRCQMESRALAAAVMEARESSKHKRKDNSNLMIEQSLLEEHAFFLSLSAFARLASEYAEVVMKIGKQGTAHTCPDCSGLWHRCGFQALLRKDLLYSREHLRATFRNMVSLVVAFTLGIFGIPDVLRSYDPGVAATIALLLSPAGVGGSLLKLNLQRIQGVVIGTVVGQLGEALFRHCGLLNSAMRGLLIFVWVTGCLFMRYDSQEYSMTGKLLAAFGAKTMVGACVVATPGEKFDVLPGYDTIVVNCLSVFVILAVELFVLRERASDNAFRSLMQAWTLLQQGVRDSFEWQKPGAIDALTLLRKASAFGVDANEEPRFWRNPWPQQSFVEVIRTMEDLAVILMTIQYGSLCRHEEVFAGDPDIPSKKLKVTYARRVVDKWRASLGHDPTKLRYKDIEFPTMKAMVDAMISHMQRVEEYLAFFAWECTEKWPRLKVKDSAQEADHILSLRTTLIKEINAGFHYDSLIRNHLPLECDHPAQLCCILTAADGVLDACRQIKMYIRLKA